MKLVSFWPRLGPYRMFLGFFVLSLVILSLSRLGLMGWQFERVNAAGNWLWFLVQGVRADLIVVSLLALPMLLLMPIGLMFPHTWQRLSLYYYLLAFAFLLLLEIATPAFVAQYDIRPNRLFIEYLKYPTEVFSMLWQGFRAVLVIGFMVHLSMTWWAFRFFRQLALLPNHWNLKQSLLVWPFVICLSFIAIRSTTDHRPANPALFAITSDAMVNSLIINSGYSVGYAIYSLQHEARSSDIYGKQPIQQTLQLGLDWPWLKRYQFTNPEFPTLHWQQASQSRVKPLNIVILLQESLGATFVESLGGVGVTPELEQLKSQGIWLDQLYATGTRSVRGIEAVMAGFAPTPAQSVVKLNNAQQHFTTLASVLQRAGYNTQFIYGGEAHFDNMRSFFTANGVQDIVDFSKFQSPKFVGSWGASDEDLLEKAISELNQLHQQSTPFFSLIFTSSNHEPFEFPDGRIELFEQPKQTVNNAVKYADWAMGQFFRKAKSQPFWQDTLFLVVADHDNRVYGSNLIPVEKFRIPGLILGADIAPETWHVMASQIDLAPTLLSLAGVSSCHPMIGRDLSQHRDEPGRALLQFDNYFALMQDSQLTILKPDGTAIAASYQQQQKQLTIEPRAVTPEQRQKVLAQVALPAYLYRESKYRSDATCSPR